MLRQSYFDSRATSEEAPRRYAINSKKSSDHGAGRSAHRVGFCLPLFSSLAIPPIFVGPVPKGVLTIEKFSIN